MYPAPGLLTPADASRPAARVTPAYDVRRRRALSVSALNACAPAGTHGTGTKGGRCGGCARTSCDTIAFHSFCPGAPEPADATAPAVHADTKGHGASKHCRRSSAHWPSLDACRPTLHAPAGDRPALRSMTESSATPDPSGAQGQGEGRGAWDPSSAASIVSHCLLRAPADVRPRRSRSLQSLSSLLTCNLAAGFGAVKAAAPQRETCASARRSHRTACLRPCGPGDRRRERPMHERTHARASSASLIHDHQAVVPRKRAGLESQDMSDAGGHCAPPLHCTAVRAAVVRSCSGQAAGTVWPVWPIGGSSRSAVTYV